ncbi:MAG TPA: hypothetical protein VN947_07195 [Polyangia bacterium]|nr:hypothetical protein [Polyangia bacterium]
MTAGIFASIDALPFFVAACVLCGLAVWGFRRTGQTGALVIAVGAGVRALRDLVFTWHMMEMYSGRTPWRMALQFAIVEQVGALISEVLIIVGVALLLRRLPARR